MQLRRVALPGLLTLCQLAIIAQATEPDENPAPCKVTSDASIEARITTNSTFGEVWEYHGRSGGAVTLHINYLLTPMGELSGSFNLDPGEINYVICIADAAQFFSLPSHIETNGDAMMVDGPELAISIKRGGITKTVHVYDPGHLGNRDEVARFLRVWARIFKPLPVRPEWHRASNNRSRSP
jgi:hypothetical protein